MARPKKKPPTKKPAKCAGPKKPSAEVLLAELPERRRRFVEHFVATGNAARSAEAAGFAHPDREGYRLLRNARVSAAIEAITGQATRDAIADREERLEILTDIVRGEVKGTLPKDRIAAANVMSRMNGEQTLNAQLHVNAQLSGAPLEQLLTLLEKTQ
jgi:phage terminase small subunit